MEEKIKAEWARADKAVMEIAPIAGIRVMTAVKPQPVDPELSAEFAIEAARLGDDTYTSAMRKAAGAEEDEDEEVEELAEEDEETRPASTAEPGNGSTISFVA
jgi:hypothetical protein